MSGCARTPDRDDRSYTDLLSYVVSNAVAGEIMAVENYSDMVALMPDVDAKIEAVQQATEECKHIRLLSKLGRSLDFDVKQRIIEPEWKAIRAAFREAVRNGDLASCLIIQDLMTETLAIVLYRTLAGETGAETDELTRRIARNILADELEHLSLGVARIQSMVVRDADHVHRALAWAHDRVMPQLFALVSTSCESLCDELAVDCASLDLAAFQTDIDTLRAQATAGYIEALDRVGFDCEVAGPLIATLASYEQQDPDSRVACGPIAGSCG